MRFCGAWQRTPVRGSSRAHATLLRAACSAHHSPLLRCIGSSATYLFIEGGGTVSGSTTRKTPAAVTVTALPPHLARDGDYGLACRSKSLALSSTFAP